MFTIIISEKGGAERRETFDKNEINVGRVQGNDLMLPKGNVSKHHARLLFRDSRFIVTDLKSTNGTYVNGRKISQATIVREGDKIYIGDFVLRLETSAGQQPAASEGYGEESQGRTPMRVGPIPREASIPPTGSPLTPIQPIVQGGPPPLPPVQLASTGALLPAATAPTGTPALSAAVAQAAINAGGPQTARPDQARPEQSVSHFPLEKDPDDSQSGPEQRPSAVPKVPGPARVPAADGRPAPRVAAAMMNDRGTHAPARATTTSGSLAQPSRAIAAPATARLIPRETSQQLARRHALTTLVDRVGDIIDLAPLKQSPLVEEALVQQLDRTVREQAKVMRDEGETPEGVDLELLARDAMRELIGLGPLGALLEDEGALEIHVLRPDLVLAFKDGLLTLADPCFTSEDALARIVARLAHQSGEPRRRGEIVVERRLPRGGMMLAVAPPATAGWVLSIRKRRRIESTLEELVRGGSMSRAVASFLESCVVARANVLVAGSGAGVLAPTLGALASAAPGGERIAVLQDGDDIAIPQALVVPMTLGEGAVRAEEVVRAATRLGVDRLVVASLAGSAGAAIIDAVADGMEGVLAGISAPSLRHALARLASQVALARDGSSIDAARDAVGESFDVAVEVALGGDGRVRVLRVAELAGSDAKGVVARDLFVLNADGSGDSAYVSSGAAPRVAHDFAARGIKVESPAEAKAELKTFDRRGWWQPRRVEGDRCVFLWALA